MGDMSKPKNAGLTGHGKPEPYDGKVKRAEPMLRVNCSSVLRSNLLGAGVSDRLSNIFPLTFRTAAGGNKRGTRQHLLVVGVSI